MIGRIDDHRALLRAALTADDALDDVRRAQIWAGLEPRLAARRRARWWLPALAVAVAAGLAVLVLREPAPTFVAPRDATLSLRLGHARATLVGPAALDVIDARPEATAIRLRGGTLLADFEGGPGRGLRITAPGATIEIVGTLFAVEVTGETTCVAVVHGAVRMTTATGAVRIAGGQRACTGGRAPGAIDEPTRLALNRHAAVLAAQVAPVVARAAPVVAPTAPTVAVAPAPEVAVAPAPEVAVAPAPEVAVVPAPEVAVVPAPKVAVVPAPKVAVVPASKVAVVPVSKVAVVPAPRVTRRRPAPERAAAVRAPDVVASSALRAPEVPRVPAKQPTPEPAKPTPEPAKLAVPSVTAESLYHTAEVALQARDLTRADLALAALIAQFPASPLVDQALYERARIAYQRHAWADAQRQLDRLAQLDASPLAEPGAYLACRIAYDAGDGSAESCLARYLARYPRSPHDRDVRRRLAEAAFRTGGCPAVAPHARALIRLYPDAALADGWRQRCPELP